VLLASALTTIITLSLHDALPILRSRGFIVDTEEAIIRAGGEIDLGKEELNLSIHPENKRLWVVSLRSPIYVQGKFDDPQIGVDRSEEHTSELQSREKLVCRLLLE